MPDSERNVAVLKNTLSSTTGRTRCSTLLEIAGLLERIDPAEAKKHAQEALAIAVELGDDSGMGNAHLSLCRSCWALTDLDRGLEHARTALIAFEKLEDLKMQAAVHGALAKVYIYQSRYTDAFRAARTCLNLHRERDDDHGMATALNDLAVISRRQGDCPRSLSYLRRRGVRPLVRRTDQSTRTHPNERGRGVPDSGCGRAGTRLSETRAPDLRTDR